MGQEQSLWTLLLITKPMHGRRSADEAMVTIQEVILQAVEREAVVMRDPPSLSFIGERQVSNAVCYSEELRCWYRPGNEPVSVSAPTCGEPYITRSTPRHHSSSHFRIHLSGRRYAGSVLARRQHPATADFPGARPSLRRRARMPDCSGQRSSGPLEAQLRRLSYQIH